LLCCACSNYPAADDLETLAIRYSADRPVMMEFVSTAVVVGIVATLMLLGIGMVVNQLLRLRGFLKQSPPGNPPDEEDHQPP
jgi:hypothetical protein